MSKKIKKPAKTTKAVEAVEAVNKTPQTSFTFSSLFAADYRLITILLIALPLLVYGQVYDFELVWDDFDVTQAYAYHLTNPFIVLPSWENFIRLFNQPYFGMYIPISYLLWGALKSLAELLSLPVNSVLHLSNVVVHIANGLLVFAVLKRFVNNKWAVAIGVGFFLLHPIQVEAVAWVSEFRVLMATLFALLSWYYYLKNRAGLAFLPLLFFVLATLCKPSAVNLVLFVFLTNHFHYQFKFGENIRRTLPFAVIALTIVFITHKFQSTYDTQFYESVIAFWQRPFAWLDSIVFYLVKIIYPYHLGASYTLSPKFISAQWWFYPLALVALVPLALGVLLGFKRKTQPVIVFALALFVAGFFTTSGFVNFSFQRYSLVADRYLYVAMIGIALFVAAVINGFTQDNQVGKHGKNNQVRWSVGALFVIILAGFASLSAFRQIPIWHNIATLWSHSVHYEITPSYARTNKGVALRRLKEVKKVTDDFDKIINTYPKHPSQQLGNAFNNKGVTLFGFKAYQQAIDAFDKAINSYPKNASQRLGDAFKNKGAALFRLKAYRQAVDAYDEAINIYPKNASQSQRLGDAFYNKGGVLLELKAHQQAIDAFDKAINTYPKNTNLGLGKVFNNKGIALIGLKAYQQAIDAFDKAINSYPKNASLELGNTFNRKGAALIELKAYQQAIDVLDKAINIYPKNNSKGLGKAFYGKGVALFELKEVQQALAAFNKAIEIDPKNKHAHKAKKDISPLLKK